MNLRKGKTSTIEKVVNAINEIKIVTSFNDNFFLCYSNNTNPICLINYDLYNFKEIGCFNGLSWNLEYKVLYFNETNDFMLVSRGELITTIYNNLNNSLLICSQGIFTKQINSNSIIYGYNNGYQVVNYTNFMNYAQCQDK